MATTKNGISIIGSILHAIIEEIDSATSLKYPLKLKMVPTTINAIIIRIIIISNINIPPCFLVTVGNRIKLLDNQINCYPS